MAHWSSVSELVYTFKHWLSRHYGFYFLLQVSLQLSCGAFMLDIALCDAIHVPMDSWSGRRPSPATELALPTCPTPAPAAPRVWRSTTAPRLLQKTQTLTLNARSVVSRTSSSSFQARSPRMEGEPLLLSGFSSMSTEAPPSPINSLYDSGRGSESEIVETPLPGSPGILQRAVQDPEGMVGRLQLLWPGWNTVRPVISLSGSDCRQGQHVARWTDRPRGPDLASVKAAANQLFIILRHWDENLQLNMLCYNPNSVRPVRVGCKLQTMRNEGFTRLELF